MPTETPTSITNTAKADAVMGIPATNYGAGANETPCTPTQLALFNW
jgi:hypothetical protein